MKIKSKANILAAIFAAALAAAVLAVPHAAAFAAADPLPILGYAKDSSGRPVPGAEVVLINEGGEDSGSSDRTLTDENGLFQFTNKPEGIYAVHVSAEGFLEQQDTVQMTRATRRVLHFALTSAKDPEPETLYLGRNVGSLRGTVVCDETDEPVADAVVTIGESFATTNGAGNFKFTGLGVGVRKIAVTRNGFEKFEKDITILPKEQNAVVRVNKIVRYATVDGRVRIRRRKSQECPPIRVYMAGKTAVTDYRGCFRFENIKEGAYPIILIYDKKELYNDTIRVRRGISAYEIIVERL